MAAHPQEEGIPCFPTLPPRGLDPMLFPRKLALCAIISHISLPPPRWRFVRSGRLVCLRAGSRKKLCMDLHEIFFIKGRSCPV